MSYQSTTTVNGVDVRLHHGMLDRIYRKHGELRDLGHLILESVNEPDLILGGHGEELLAIKYHHATPLGSKHMVVVYREDRHLIITAFLTSDLSKLLRRRQQVWRKPSK